jgi:Domain of unknown function (DUF1996)
MVNAALIPASRAGSATADVTVNGELGFKDAGGIGAFRTVCQFSHMNFDDPLVFPGQQGATHLHVFWGNTSTRFDSTPQSIATSGGSTCRGGIINRSAYWAPAMIDTRTGTPQVPHLIHVYYKTGYNGIADAQVRPWPQGLRMIAGSASSQGTQPHVKYGCVNGAITSTIPSCPAGTLVAMDISFPQCWDGVNLSSPDNKSHVAYPSGGKCPASHPVATPELSIHIWYKNPNGDSANWRLSSDRNGAPAGSSGHADWINGWDPEIMQTWVRRIINPGLSGGSSLIGDGRIMNCNFPGCL